MATLYLLRHGKTERDDPRGDYWRRLTPRGIADAKRIGAFLKTTSVRPDSIISSSAVRAEQTARIVKEFAEFSHEIEFRDDLYSTTPDVWLEALSVLPPHVQGALAVGHNPTLEDLCNDLAALPSPRVTLSTCALAVLDFNCAWSEIADHKGTLRQIVEPD